MFLSNNYLEFECSFKIIYFYCIESQFFSFHKCYKCEILRRKLLLNMVDLTAKHAYSHASR